MQQNIFKCDCCGKDSSNPYLSLNQELLCYLCRRFVMYLEQNTIDKDNFVNNYLYTDGEDDILYFAPPVSPKESKRGLSLGFGGLWFKVEFFDGTVQYTNNMWCSMSVQDIPVGLLGKFHPNVKSIISSSDLKEEAFKALGW